MAKTKRPSALYAKLVSFFKSRMTRNIIFSILLVLSGLVMIMLDEGNFVRRDYLTFLDDNFVLALFEAVGVHQFNIGMASWIYFGAVFILAFVLFIGNIWSVQYVNAVTKTKRGDEGSKGKRALHTFLFNLILVVVAAAIIFGLIMYLRSVDTIDFGTFDVELFLNLLYTLLICLAVMIIIPVIIIIVIYILKWFFWSIGALLFIINRFYKDISTGSKIAEKKAQEELDEIRSAQGESMGDDINGGTAGIGGGADGKKQDKFTEKDMFFALARIDEEHAEFKQEPVNADITLEEFVRQFQAFAIQHKIYYELPVLRSFIAGMAASRLIILEGLSGTGKSMMPRMFTEFTGCRSFFAPVQATWRDKSDMLGYYSEFTKIFKVTDFLKNLYTASYYNDVNMMVLDEMNLSRIEYYFADFLSVLEYPQEDWLIKLIEPEVGQKLPARLPNGYVRIPENTWFIGTANTDDSTFTITDKVYDRAFIIDFKERFSPITSEYNSDPLHVDTATLTRLFDEAKATEAYNLTDADTEKFLKLCDFVRDRFDIRFGNRIMVQINNFVPVYVAMGGKKEEALDIMFARKVLRKLNGMYDDYIKDSLVEFKKLLTSLYGKGLFVECELLVDKMIKRLV